MVFFSPTAKKKKILRNRKTMARDEWLFNDARRELLYFEAQRCTFCERHPSSCLLENFHQLKNVKKIIFMTTWLCYYQTEAQCLFSNNSLDEVMFVTLEPVSILDVMWFAFIRVEILTCDPWDENIFSEQLNLESVSRCPRDRKCQKPISAKCVFVVLPFL